MMGMALGGLAASGLAVLFLFDPAQHGFYPRCALYRTTGLLCPGCGTLRAMHQLLHGQVAAAMHYNALVVCSVPLWAWLGARLAMLRWRNQPTKVAVRPIWLWGGLVAIVAFGILRNMPFAQVAWLAP
jgi:hypothetical protein